MYAIVEIAGKQFRVEEKKHLRVPLLNVESGKKVEFDKVFVFNDDKAVKIGAPLINSLKVSATVVEHGREKKVVVFKKKRRKGYQVKNGHRQDYSLIVIDKIGTGSAAKPKTEEKPKVETKAKAAPKSATLPKAEIKTEETPVAKSTAKPKTVAKPKVEPKAKVAPKTAAKPEAELKKEETPSKKSAAKPKTVAKPKVEPKAKTAPKTVAKPKAKDNKKEA